MLTSTYWKITHLSVVNIFSLDYLLKLRVVGDSDFNCLVVA